MLISVTLFLASDQYCSVAVLSINREALKSVAC